MDTETNSLQNSLSLETLGTKGKIPEKMEVEPMKLKKQRVEAADGPIDTSL